MINLNQWGADPKPTPKKIDYESINSHAMVNLLSVLEHFQPGGRLNGKEYVCGSVTGGQGDSTSTNINTGIGKEFADGYDRMKWGDPISLVATVLSVSQSDAAIKLADHLRIDPYLPPPPPVQKPSVDRAVTAEKARLDSLSLWHESVPCPSVHPYLVRKKIPSNPDIRFHQITNDIIVPLYNEKAELQCIQKIPASEGRKKLFLEGSAKSGHFFLFAGKADVVYICEGYATAASVHQVTGCSTFMAVDAGNVPKVAKVAAKMFPIAQFVFAADNDAKGEHNTGVVAAEKAVAEIGKGIVLPPPCAAGQKLDWNDYVCLNGVDAAYKLLARNRTSMLIDAKTMRLTEPDFVIDECVESPCTGMVFGASGSGKSFLVLDWAFCCVTGKDWLGKKVKEGPVIYICGEGRHAIPRRIAAWESYHGVEIPHNRFLISNMRIEFDSESVTALGHEIEHMVEQIGIPPVMIIIDTFARALPANAEENSNKDAGLFVNECDRLQHHFNTAVLIVHHTGHSESAKHRARGASSLKGAMDVEVLLDGERKLIEWTKTKDIEAHHPVRYTLHQHVYGSGKYDNSCVLQYDLNYDSKEVSMTDMEKLALETLEQACSDLGSTTVSMDTWKDVFRARYKGSKDSADRILRRARTGLCDLNMVQYDDEMVTIKSHKAVDNLVENSMFGNLIKK